jgi:hypothetical protein
MHDKTETAAHYRLRAEEIRAIAQGVFDKEERKKLTAVAEDYELWAREADRAPKPNANEPH